MFSLPSVHLVLLISLLGYPSEGMILQLMEKSTLARGAQAVALPREEIASRSESASIRETARQRYIEVNEKEDAFRSALTMLFPETAKRSYLHYRVRSIDVLVELLAAAEQVEHARDPSFELSLEWAREVIDEGVVSCFVFLRPTPTSTEVFLSELIDAIRARELKVKEIAGGHCGQLQPCLSRSQMELIETANREVHRAGIRVLGSPFEPGTGIKHLGPSLDVEYKDGAEARIHLCSQILWQLDAATQMFRRQLDPRSFGPGCFVDQDVEALDVRFAALAGDHDLAQVYASYAEAVGEFLDSWLRGDRDRTPPVYPAALSSYSELAMDRVAAAIDARLLKGVLAEGVGFEVRDEHLTYESSQFVSVTQPAAIRELIGGLVSGGSRLRGPFEEVMAGLREWAQMAQGLHNVATVVLWEENEYLARRRAAIRASRALALEGTPREHPWEEGVIDLPEYDEGDADNLRSRQRNQSPTRVAIQELHFMQDSCGFFSGEHDEYDVFSTARAIRSDPGFLYQLPPLQVWRDTTGRVWSLDHRRLVSYVLSGVIRDVPVRFVDRETAIRIEANGYKFTNPTGGRAIVLEVGDEDGHGVVVLKASALDSGVPFDSTSFDADLLLYRDHLLAISRLR